MSVHALGGEVHEEVTRDLDEDDDEGAERDRADMMQQQTTKALRHAAVATHLRLVPAPTRNTVFSTALSLHHYKSARESFDVAYLVKYHLTTDSEMMYCCEATMNSEIQMSPTRWYQVAYCVHSSFS